MANEQYSRFIDYRHATGTSFWRSKPFVREYDKATVREAVLREVLRGGQVYFPA